MRHRGGFGEAVPLNHLGPGEFLKALSHGDGQRSRSANTKTQTFQRIDRHPAFLVLQSIAYCVANCRHEREDGGVMPTNQFQRFFAMEPRDQHHRTTHVNAANQVECEAINVKQGEDRENAILSLLNGHPGGDLCSIGE